VQRHQLDSCPVQLLDVAKRLAGEARALADRKLGQEEHLAFLVHQIRCAHAGWQQGAREQQHGASANHRRDQTDRRNLEDRERGKSVLARDAVHQQIG